MGTIRDLVEKTNKDKLNKTASSKVRHEVLPEKETIEKVSKVVEDIVSSPQATEQEKVAANSLKNEIFDVIAEKTAAINKQNDETSVEFMKKMGQAFAEGMQDGMPQAPMDQVNLGEMAAAAEQAAGQTGVVPAPDVGIPPVEPGVDPMVETIIEEVKDTAGKIVAQVTATMADKAKAEGAEEALMATPPVAPEIIPPAVDPGMVDPNMVPPVAPEMVPQGTEQMVDPNGMPKAASVIKTEDELAEEIVNSIKTASDKKEDVEESKKDSIKNDETYKTAAHAIVGEGEEEIAANMLANEPEMGSTLSEEVGAVDGIEGAEGAEVDVDGIEEAAEQLAKSIVKSEDKDEDGGHPAPLTAIGDTPDDDKQEELKDEIVAEITGESEVAPEEGMVTPEEAAVAPEEAVVDQLPEEGALDNAVMPTEEAVPEEIAGQLPEDGALDASVMPAEEVAPEVIPEESAALDNAVIPSEAPVEAPKEEKKEEEAKSEKEVPKKKVTEDDAAEEIAKSLDKKEDKKENKEEKKA